MVKKKNWLDNYSNFIEVFFILISLVIIFISISHSSNIPYFWHDFTFAKQAHNENLSKIFLEILPNSRNIHGITIWPLEPSLNFLSKLNYDITNKYEYFKYLSIFRVLELITLIFFLQSFNEKLNTRNILIIFFLYLILLVNFNRYDHESYINFSIIIFSLFHIASIKIKNNFFFFLLIFLGNLWSFLINPIYFFVICFGPLIFFYTYYLYHKKFKKFFLVLLGNIPFTILFVMLSLGTSRVALSDLYLGYDSIHRNFAIYTSENFILVSILFSTLILKILLKNNNFYCWFFILFIIFSAVIGGIFRADPQNFKMPPPYQFEYGFQYFLIFSMYQIIKSSEKDFLFNFIISILAVLLLYRSIFFSKQFLKLEIFAKNNQQIEIDANFPKTNLWFKDNDNFFLKNDLKNKKVFINIPNTNSNFYKSLIKSDLESIEDLYWKIFNYNKNFNGSLQNHFLWKNEITTSGGYSHILDINVTLANYFNPSVGEYTNVKEKIKKRINFTDNKIYRYQTVPEFNYKNPLLNLYNFDYILSDVVLGHEINKTYKIDKIYKFEQFNLYLYKNIKLKKSTKISQTKIITDLKNYSDDINKFDKELFVEKINLDSVNNLKKFCIVESTHKNGKIVYSIKKSDSEDCLAVFPIPFSHNNLFIKKNFYDNHNYKCETFRVQYYFHGCIIKADGEYILKKNNLFLYAIGSFKDFFDYKFKKY